MVMPVNQKCPECGQMFAGSDALGQSCDACLFAKVRKWQSASEVLLDTEKRRRVYYQDIVYAVCRELERAFAMRVHRGEVVVCGTIEEPSTQVQELMKELVDRDSARAAKEAANDPGSVSSPATDIILGIGKRCPKCQSLMVHTRIGGYRCNRGCQ